jgi:hypothetical protein
MIVGANPSKHAAPFISVTSPSKIGTRRIHEYAKPGAGAHLDNLPWQCEILTGAKDGRGRGVPASRRIA